MIRFEREGKRPDGSLVKVAFSLAFAEDRRAPASRFAVCQQHFPENFWNPAFQKHANGTTGITGVIVAAATPMQHHDFMLAFAGAAAARVVDDGFAVDTPRGLIEVITPAAFLARFGVTAPDVDGGARLAALQFAVEDPALLQGIPEEAGIAGLDAGGTTVIGPTDAMGAVLVFGASR